MNERDLLIFKYLREFKNVTKTANALFISQPTLTTRLKQLESELDTRLVFSNNKGVYLTAAGIEVAEFADETLDRIEELKSRIKAIDDAEAGLIKLAAPNIICKYYLPEFIKAFKVEHPKVKFDIIVVPSSKVVRLMKEGKCHFGFLRDDFGWEGSKYLLETNYIAAVSTHPFELKDLEHMNRVDYTTDTYYQRMLELWWNETFNKPSRVDIMVNSLDLCKEMVFNGLGFGLLPSIFLSECPEAHSYILKDKDGKPIERNTWLISKPPYELDDLSKRFLSFIEAQSFNSFLRLVARRQ